MYKVIKKKMLVFALVFTAIFAGIAVPTAVNMTFIETAEASQGIYISRAGQVVDSMTFNGKTIQSVYAPRRTISNYNWDTTYCCAALVKRFYSTVYGITVHNLYPGNKPLVLNNKGYFTKVSNPQIGDIIAFPDHWGIVKNINGNNVTVFEQNAWKDTNYTQAAVGRVISKGNASYYRYSGAVSQAPTVNTENASWSNSVTSTTTDNIKVSGKISFPSSKQFTRAGIEIWDSNGSLVKKYEEGTGVRGTYMNITYDFKNEVKASLKAGTKYTYRYYAVTGGKTYYSNKYTASTNALPVTQTASWTNSVTSTTTDNIKISARISFPSSQQFTKAGIEIWDNNGSLVKRYEEGTGVRGTYMNITYDFKNEVKASLKAGTKYTYRVYASAGGRTYYSSKYSVATKANQSASLNCSWTNTVRSRSRDNLIVRGVIRFNSTMQFTKAGIEIWDSNGKKIKTYEEKTNVKNPYMNIDYNFKNELKLSLKSGKKYTYRYFATTGGRTYYSMKYTASTT